MGDSALKLHPYQAEAVCRIQAAPQNRFVLNFEPGLGKTATAIEALRTHNSPRALIVTPALVKSAWASEFDRWWPEHPDVKAITCGRKRTSLSKRAAAERDAAFAAPYQICSYNLAAEVDAGPWNAIILDELHKLKDPMSAQSKAIKAVCRTNPHAMILGLTGTLMPDKIIDVWNQLDTIWPGAWGRPQKSGRVSWSFATRYSNVSHNGYGYDFKGINLLNVDELQERLKKVSSRVTKAEVADLLPPFHVSMLPITADHLKIPKWNDTEDFFCCVGNVKIPFILDWVSDTIEQAEHIAVMTHLKATAQELTTLLKQQGYAAFHVTGDLSIEQRLEVIGAAKATPKSILVATMHSVGIGIDLTAFSTVIFAELYWRPETIIQALGRFSRLSGKVPSSVSLLVVKGTMDEAVGLSLLSKIEAINGAIKGGAGEVSLETSLQGTDADFFADVQQNLLAVTEKNPWDD